MCIKNGRWYIFYSVFFKGKQSVVTKGKNRKLGSRSLDCPSTTENDLSAIQKSGGLFVPFLRAAVSHFVSLT